ncbi:MAG: hypothetical protein LC789_01250 [Actinobacteria bacterium]|nr:hypothetical protein [Actinomycetota bacterium]MCA1722300.1 hypothetical protein [Actinomycetota bacterium]
MSESPGWASPGGWTPPPAAPAPDFSAPPGWGGPQQAPGGWGAPRPPELRPGVVPLRPLGLGELLDGAVGVIRRYPRPCLGLSAGIAVVSTAINVVLALTAFKPLLDLDSTSIANGNTDQLDGVIGGAALGGGGGAIISALATLLLTGVMTAVVGKAVLGEPMTTGQAWAQVRPALLRLLGIALLTALIVYGAIGVGIGVVAAGAALAGARSLLVAVPLAVAVVALSVHLYVRLSLAPAAAVLEGSGIRESLRRSGVLVRRSWWRVCGILLLTLVIASFVSQVLQIPFVLFGAGPTGLGRLTSPDGTTTRVVILSYIGAGIAQTLVAPFTAGVRALLYVDRRMRAEGLDVALTAAVAPPAA